jgi:hypothetical protein
MQWVFCTAACFLVANANLIDEPAPNERHFTVRFQNRWGAYKLSDMAFSPDGRQLAIATSNGWVAIIRTDTGSIANEFETASFAIGYSRDGGRLVLLGGDKRKLYHVQEKVAYVLQGKIPTGYLGMNLQRRNGKVLFHTIAPGGPLHGLGTIAAGDELVAVGEGEEGPMKQLIGESTKRAVELLSGPVGSVVRLAVIHEGADEPRVHTVKREWREASNGQLTYKRLDGLVWGENLVWSVMDGYHTFTSASTGEIVSWFKQERGGDVRSHALSPDSRRFAILARQKDERNEFAIEVFDLRRRERETVISVPRAGYFDMVFSPDGNEVALASWDSVDFIDLDLQQIVRTMRLTDNGSDGRIEEHEPDEIMGSTARESLARAAPGRSAGLTRSISQIVDSLAISPRGLVATGSPRGVVRLWDAKTGRFLKLLGRGSGKEIERIRFSPDGKWMAYFDGGMLHLVDVSECAR